MGDGVWKIQLRTREWPEEWVELANDSGVLYRFETADDAREFVRRLRASQPHAVYRVAPGADR